MRGEEKKHTLGCGPSPDGSLLGAPPLGVPPPTILGKVPPPLVGFKVEKRPKYPPRVWGPVSHKLGFIPERGIKFKKTWENFGGPKPKRGKNLRGPTLGGGTPHIYKALKPRF